MKQGHAQDVSNGQSGPGARHERGALDGSGARRERLVFSAVLVGIACVYAGIAARLNAYGVFWSPDPGAKFAMVLATPLLLYSVVFWEHSLLMLLAAATGYFLLRALKNGGARFACAAGAAVGFGVWIHGLFLVFFAALALAAVPLIKALGGRR